MMIRPRVSALGAALLVLTLAAPASGQLVEMRKQVSVKDVLLGTWTIDTKVLMDSAPAVAEQMGKPEMVKRVRATLRSVFVTLKLRTNGRYFFKAKTPRGTLASIGQWERVGLDVKLTRQRGARVLPRITLAHDPVGPLLRVHHPVMHGMKWVLRNTDVPLECETDVNAYSDKAKAEINKMMTKTASEFILETVVWGLERLNQAINKALVSKGFNKVARVLKKKVLGKKFVSKLRFAFNAFAVRHTDTAAYKILRGMAIDIGSTLGYLQIIEAASSGAYQEAGLLAAMQAIGAYSPAAGLLITIGQAAKADWDAFSQRVDKKRFRKWYEELYLNSDLVPDPKRHGDGPRQRLSRFIGDVKFALSNGGVGAASGSSFAGNRAKYLARMIQTFARRQLGTRLSDKDFAMNLDTTPTSFKSKALRPVLAQVFHAFEKTFERDTQAEALRQAMLQRNKRAEKFTKGAALATDAAFRKHWEKVWGSKPRANMVFCRVVQELGLKPKQFAASAAR